MPGVKNFHVKAAVDRERKHITFLYEVHHGHADQSYGVHVAESAGLPEAITARAAAMSEQLDAAERREKRRSTGTLQEADSNAYQAIKKLRSIVTHAFSQDTVDAFVQETKQAEGEIKDCLRILKHRMPKTVVF